MCASALWFLFGVETRGRTLEELDEVFDAPWPAMASARKRKIAIREGDVEVIQVRLILYVRSMSPEESIALDFR